MRVDFVFVLMMGACASASPAPSRVPVVTKAPVDLDATIARDVHSPKLTYTLRASRLSNLVYELDCMSGVTSRCSSEAFKEYWTKNLAWTDDDRAALHAWSEIHSRYSTTLVPEREKEHPTALPIPNAMTRTVTARIRLAAYGARDETDLLERFGLFIAPSDVAVAQQILARFSPRFEKLWLERRSELAAKVDGFATLMERPDVVAIVESVRRFYEPDLPENARVTIELIARPEREGSDYGEQLGDHALVETLVKEQPSERLDVVLHELFHRWFASAPDEKKRALVDAFVKSPDPFGRAAFGLLDEALATAFGNGLIARAVDRADFDKRLAKPLGLYHDRFIDPTAKTILAWLEARIAAGKTLFEPDFVPEYIKRVSALFPKGVAPILHMRPLVSAYEPSLEDVERHFYDVIRSGWVESEDGFEHSARELIAKHPTWGTAIVVLSAHLDQIENVTPVIDKKMIVALHKEKAPFVYTIARANAEPVFVFVAPDAEAMRALMDRFAESESPVFGVWR